MPWFRVDDALPMNPSTTAIPRSRRAAAVGLWTLAGSWSAGQLTDGFVPEHMVEELAGTAEMAADLVASGFWDEAEGGYRFAAWEGEQPMRDAVLAQRQKNAEKVSAWRRRQNAKPDSDPVGNQGSNPVTNPAPVPTRPVPTHEESPTDSLSSGSADADLRPEIDHLLDLLDAEIIRNGGKKPSRTKRNRDAVRLMLDRDEHSVAQIEAAIRWCQADEFWRSNILSASKLREKYDQLRLAATRGQGPRGANRLTPEQRARQTYAELSGTGRLGIDPTQELTS